jgi:hypothetical protein
MSECYLNTLTSQTEQIAIFRTKTAISDPSTSEYSDTKNKIGAHRVGRPREHTLPRSTSQIAISPKKTVKPNHLDGKVSVTRKNFCASHVRVSAKTREVEPASLEQWVSLTGARLGPIVSCLPVMSVVE